MAYNFPQDAQIDELRSLIVSVWEVESVVPEVTPTYKWAIDPNDLPMGMIEIYDEVTVLDGGAIHDLRENMPVRLWYLAQFAPGDDVPTLMQQKIREMNQALYADRSLAATANIITLRSWDWSGKGADWPVEDIEEIENVNACYVHLDIRLDESRFS